MKQGDLSPVVGTLRHALRDLQAKWADTKEVWNDQVAIHFEEKSILPLDAPVSTAIKAIERLGTVMVKAYDACSPDRD